MGLFIETRDVELRYWTLGVLSPAVKGFELTASRFDVPNVDMSRYDVNIKILISQIIFWR